MIPSERASQEEQNEANFSSVYVPVRSYKCVKNLIKTPYNSFNLIWRGSVQQALGPLLVCMMSSVALSSYQRVEHKSNR